MYGVSFPYFEQLAAIYGKDIATGENAGWGTGCALKRKKVRDGNRFCVATEEGVGWGTSVDII